VGRGGGIRSEGGSSRSVIARGGEGVSFIWVDLEEDASDWGNEEDEEDAVDDDGKLMMIYVS
jgi:hypothetical protein